MLFSKLGFRVAFNEERLPSGPSAIKPRSAECCSDDCPSGSFSHLHSGSLELSQSDHWVLGHLSCQGPSPLMAQFVCAAPGRVLIVPKFFRLRFMEANLLHAEFLLPSQDLCLDTTLSMSSSDRSFNLMAWFLL